MKKTIVFALISFLLLSLAPKVLAVALGFQAKVGLYINYYAISDSIYRDLYGSGNLMFGGSISLEMIRKLEIRAEGNYFRDKGKMSVTEEELTFTINQIIVGIRFRVFESKKFSPYLGAGVDFFSYKENYPDRFEDVSDSTTGFHIEVGNYYNLAPRFHLDFNIRYIKADAKPFKEGIGLGGLKAGVGIEYRF